MEKFTSTMIDAYFYMSPSFKQHKDVIENISIDYPFCSMNTNLIEDRFHFNDHKNSILFLLVDSMNAAERQINSLKVNKPVFVLLLGNSQEVVKITDKAWYFQTTEEALSETIRDCLLRIPLLNAFRDCVKSIKAGNKITKELKLISCIEPVVTIFVDKEIEMGRSVRITTEHKPADAELPSLVYKINDPKIANCDGLSIYGLHEGTCRLEVYIKGAMQPFFTKELNVYKRNRITTLLISDESLTLGEGDKKALGIDYYPENADNAHTISWSSSDERIAMVNQEGRVLALREGTCRIICTAENVSAQCIVTIKPYLKDIETNLYLYEEDILYMNPLEQLPIVISCIPENCIDGDIVMESSDGL
ncbi:MAG: Ig-like domain-containing protein, partial [Erysipelotrichaceae bacterium]|nr:Ig-like domain-containing protein [Erysipelotrichaceae bacterium]